MAPSKKIIEIIAVMLILLGFGYIYGVTFLPTNRANIQIEQGIIETIKGMFWTIVGFYFGSSIKKATV